MAFDNHHGANFNGRRVMRVAILDDYQNTALSSADWSSVSSQANIEVFNDHIHDEDAVAARLQHFEIICAMRERTPFPRSLIEKLPNLKLIISSGMRNRGIDVDAAKDNDVIVCGRSAKAGQAMQGTTTTLMGKGKRGGMLVLPGWGLMRVSAHTWDLIGVTSSTSTKPIHKRVPGSKGSCQARAARLLANARPRGSKTVACHIREWHNSTAISNRDNVNDVIV